MPLDIQRGGGEEPAIPLPHFLGCLGIFVHIDEGVGDAVAIEKTSGADTIAAPVGAIDHDARPGATLLSDRWTLHLPRSIIIAHEEVADAMAGLGDILLMAITGTDVFAILPGIAGPLLSRTVGPTEGISLPTYALDDPLPNVLVGVQAIGAHLRITEGHPPGPVDQLLQALACAGRPLHIILLVRAALRWIWLG